MQDRYAGDVGDFGKIGLLKCLQTHYLIPEKISECDPGLAEKLTRIARGDRSIKAIQDKALIPDAVYYDNYLSVDGRSEWHKRAVELFADRNLIFMDPDNGMLVKSVGKRSARSVKYAFYEEVKDYFDRGKSVLIYNHRCRKPE